MELPKSHAVSVVRSIIHTLIGLIIFVIIGDGFAYLLDWANINLPGSVAGLIFLVILLLILPTRHLSDLLEPAAALLLRWLALFFVPALVGFPATFHLIPGWDYPKLAVIFVVGVVFSETLSGWLVVLSIYCRHRLFGPAADISPRAATSPRLSGLILPPKIVFVILSITTVLFIVFASVPRARQPIFFIINILVLPVFFTLSQYLQARFRRFHFPNPLILSTVLSILFLYILGLIQGTSLVEAIHQYLPSASINIFRSLSTDIGPGDIYIYILNAAIVAMALPIFHEKRTLLVHGFDVIVASLLTAFISICFTICAARLLHVSVLVSRSLVLRTATAPISIASVKYVGGNSAIAGAASALTGLIGASIWRIIADARFNRFTRAITRGFCVGASSHGLGTAVLTAEEPESAPFASVGFVLVGVSSALLVAIPLVRDMIDVILGH